MPLSPSIVMSPSKNIATALGLAVVLAAYEVLLAGGQGQIRRNAVPLEAVAAIVSAFEAHSIVALGEQGHGNQQSHDLRIRLLRDERIVSVVDDLVVEFGSARYQDVVDRFVRGETVEDSTLRKIWQDTTVPDYLWDRPIYEAFFREVRSANMRAPGRQLRVLLGDPPIVWEHVANQSDLQRWQGQRDLHAAEVVKRNVVDKGRRALVLYGDAHLAHRPGGQGLVARVEKDTGVAIFTISRPIAVAPTTLQSDVSSWPAPSIALVPGTRIGAAEVEFHKEPDGTWRSVLFENRFDAFLYLGPPGTRTTPRLLPSLCADAAYIEMRLRRMALDPSDRPEELHQECAP
jgi:hypothetical protein